MQPDSTCKREAGQQRSQQYQAHISAQHYTSEIATEFIPAIAQVKNTEKVEVDRKSETAALSRVADAKTALDRVDALTDYILAAQNQRAADKLLASADFTRARGAETSAKHFHNDMQGLGGVFMPPRMRAEKERAFVKDMSIAKTLQRKGKHDKVDFC